MVTRPDAPAGRGRTLRPSPIRQLADQHGLAVLTPAHPRDPDFQSRLRALAPDCCPVVAYGALVPRPVLDIPRHGWVNLHFSLLPAWRGAAPVQHAVLAGDAITGASTFRLEEGLDTGPVFGTVTEVIRDTDTAGDLLSRLAEGGAGLLVATLDAIEDGHCTPVPQPADDVSLAPKLTVNDARIPWSAPALRVDRVIRACAPAPGAWSTLRGRRLKLGVVAATEESLSAGELRDGLVGTATTAVRLGQVQPEGKGPMAAADWLRGLRVEPGERFT